jgi:hypothetical protein
VVDDDADGESLVLLLAELIEALKTAHWQVRQAVAQSLGEIKDLAAEPALIEALKDPQWTVRCWRLTSSWGFIYMKVRIHSFSCCTSGIIRLLRFNRSSSS